MTRIVATDRIAGLICSRMPFHIWRGMVCWSKAAMNSTTTTSSKLVTKANSAPETTPGKISGKVKVSWAAGQWSFVGTATVAEGVVDGLSEFTAQVVYEGGNWSFGINRFDYNLKWDKATEGGGLVVSKDVDITINAEMNKAKE